MNGYTSYLWALLASSIAIFLETLYRSNARSWVELLPVTLVPMIFLNFALFRLLRTADSLISAFIVFSFSNLILRTGVVLFYLNEHVSQGTWFALVLLTCAQAAKLFIK